MIIIEPGPESTDEDRQQWTKMQGIKHRALSIYHDAVANWQNWGNAHKLWGNHRADPVNMPRAVDQHLLERQNRELRLDDAVDALEALCIEKGLEVSKYSRAGTGEC